jgi:hypothetical protein
LFGCCLRKRADDSSMMSVGWNSSKVRWCWPVCTQLFKEGLTDLIYIEAYRLLAKKDSRIHSTVVNNNAVSRYIV